MSKNITKTEQLVNEFTIRLREHYYETMRELIMTEMQMQLEYAEKFKALTQRAVSSALGEAKGGKGGKEGNGEKVNGD